MKTNPLSILVRILLLACLCLPGCSRGHGGPVSPPDEEHAGNGPVIDIFDYIGDPRYTRTDHPFVGAEMVTRRSADTAQERSRVPQRGGEAIYNWELGSSLVEGTTQSSCNDTPTTSRMWAYEYLAWKSWAENHFFATNLDAFHKDGVTHLVCQQVEVNNGVQSSKIFYSRWNGNMGKEGNPQFWTTPIPVSPEPLQDSVLHVTPSVAVNDRGDVLVVWNTHDDPGEDKNVFQRPDDPEDGGNFTYSDESASGGYVQLQAAILRRNSAQFDPLDILDNGEEAYGAYPDVVDFHYSDGSIGFLLVYEDREHEREQNPGYFIKARTIGYNDGNYVVGGSHELNTAGQPGVFPAIVSDNEFVYMAWYSSSISELPGDPVEVLEASTHVSEVVAHVAWTSSIATQAYWTPTFGLAANVTVPLNRILRHPGLAVDGRGRHAVTWAGFEDDTSSNNQVWVQIYDGGWWGDTVVKAPDPNAYSATGVDVNSYIHRQYRDVLLAEADPSANDICELCCDHLFPYPDEEGIRQRWPSQVEFRDPDVALDGAGGVNISYTLLFQLEGDTGFSYWKCDCDPPKKDDPPFEVVSSDPTVAGHIFYESDCAYWNGSGWTLRDVFKTDIMMDQPEAVAASFARARVDDYGVFLNQGYSGGIDRSPGGGYALGLGGHFETDPDILIHNFKTPTVNGLVAAPIVRVVQDNITVILGAFSNYSGGLEHVPNAWKMNNTYFPETMFTNNQVPFIIWLPNEDRVDFGGNGSPAEWGSAVFSDPIDLGPGAAPDMVCDKLGNTFLTYSSQDTGYWHVMVRRRAPDGQWEVPVDVSGAGSHLNDELPSIAVSPTDGSIYLAWQRRDQNEPLDDLDVGYGIIYAKSADLGRSWTIESVTTNYNCYRGDCDISIDAGGKPHIVWVETTAGVGGTKIRRAYKDGIWTIPLDPVSDESAPVANFPSIMPQVACYAGLNPYVVVVWSQWGDEPEAGSPNDARRYFIARRVIGQAAPLAYAWDERDLGSFPDFTAADHFLSPRIDIDQSTGVETLVYFGLRAPDPQLEWVDFLPYKTGGLACGRSRRISGNSVDRDPVYWEIPLPTSVQDGNRAKCFPNCSQETKNFIDSGTENFSQHICLFHAFPVLDVDSNAIPQVLWSRWEHHLQEPTSGQGSTTDVPRFLTVFDDLESFLYDWNEIAFDKEGIGYFDPYRYRESGFGDVNNQSDCGVALTEDDPDHSLGGPLMGVETPINHSALACDPHNRVHLAFVVDPSFSSDEPHLGPDLPDTEDNPAEQQITFGNFTEDVIPYVFYQYPSDSPSIWYLQKMYSDPSW